jgi:hypothetical protein
MKHPELVLRSFKKSDEEMLQEAEVKLALFIEKKGSFTARFPNLADPFAATWTTTIATARDMVPDYESVANQSDKTTTLEALMDQGRTLFQTLMLYTQIAFPKNASLLKLMGQSQYDSARKSQLKFPILLRTAYGMASKPEYKPALIAGGMKETDIALLETLAKSIVDQDVAQEKSIIDRSIDSSQRILAMNAVWENMALVCQCAKLVFQNDAALYNLFLLDDGTTASPTPKAPPAPPAI